MEFNEINISSSNNQNDYLSFSIAMDAATNSEINLFNIGGTGILQYTTKSDYIFELSRHRSFTNESKPLSTTELDMVGYPDGLAWVPGEHVSMLSQESTVTNKLPITQDVTLLSEDEYHKGEFLILDDYYNISWPAEGDWFPVELTSIEDSNKSSPHLEIKTNQQGSLGRRSYAVRYLKERFSLSETHANVLLLFSKELMALEILSPKLEGSLFKFNLKRNYLEEDLLGVGSIRLDEKPGLIYGGLVDKNTTLTEWNSIFDVNGSANADSIFRDGSNRDEVFYQHLEEYINKNWYGKLKRNLWGDAIEDESVELTTRDPKILKDNILYCFYYFGASDDVKNLGLFSYKDFSTTLLDTVINWHIGLGSKSRYSSEHRALSTELAYLPAVKKQQQISRVVGLSPRSSYAYDVEYNKIEGSNRNAGYEYSITFVDSPGGSEASYPEPLYKEGQEVILLLYPQNNFFLSSITAVDLQGNPVEIVDNKIIMPASNVIVTAIYDEVSDRLINFIGGWTYDQSTTTQQMWQNGNLLVEETDRDKNIVIGTNARMKIAEVAFNQSSVIGEIVVIDENVSNANRQKIEGYLAHKWSMQQFLPESHPYKSSGVIGWRPSDIGSPLVGWYNETSIVESNGEVIEWTDKTSSGASFYVSAGVDSPIYSELHGLPAIRFDGAETPESDYMQTVSGGSPFLAGGNTQRQLSGLSCFVAFKYLPDLDGFSPCGRASLWGHSDMSLNVHAPWVSGNGFWDIDAGINRSRIVAKWMDCVLNISFVATEQEILSTEPTNPSGEVVIAYGSDTSNLYVYYEGIWYIYENIDQGPFNINFQATEAEILATEPTNPSGEATVAYGTDTANLYIYYDGTWYIVDSN